MLRFIFNMGCLLIIATNVIQAGYASDREYLEAVEEPIACYRSMMAYSNGLGKDTSDIEKACWLGRSENAIWIKRSYDELSFWRNTALRLTEADKKLCGTADDNDWQTVSDEIRKTIEGSRKIRSIFPDTTEDIPDQMSPVEAAIFFRSALEQEMTRMLMQRRRSDQKPIAPCQSFQKAYTLARLDNVLYFDAEGMFERRGENSWKTALNLRLWLVAQHADFFPAFQAQGLAYFRASSSEKAMSVRYRDMLHNRIIANFKADWYQKFAEEESTGEADKAG